MSVKHGAPTDVFLWCLPSGAMVAAVRLRGVTERDSVVGKSLHPLCFVTFFYFSFSASILPRVLFLPRHKGNWDGAFAVFCVPPIQQQQRGGALTLDVTIHGVGNLVGIPISRLGNCSRMIGGVMNRQIWFSSPSIDTH